MMTRPWRLNSGSRVLRAVGGLLRRRGDWWKLREGAVDGEVVTRGRELSCGARWRNTALAHRRLVRGRVPRATELVTLGSKLAMIQLVEFGLGHLG